MTTTLEKLEQYYDYLADTVIEEIKEKITLPKDKFLASNVLGMVGTKLIEKANEGGQAVHSEVLLGEVLDATYFRFKNNACVIENYKTTDPDYLFNYKWNRQKNILKKYKDNEVTEQKIPAKIERITYGKAIQITLQRMDNHKEILSLATTTEEMEVEFFKILQIYADRNGYEVCQTYFEEEDIFAN